MKLLGRFACLAAVLGLFFQFVAANPAQAVEDSDHAVATAGAGDCDGSHCPKEPLHDHCCSFCSHFFTAVPDSSEGFHVRRPVTASYQALGQESALEGFPAGLFIPPRLS